MKNEPLQLYLGEEKPEFWRQKWGVGVFDATVWVLRKFFSSTFFDDNFFWEGSNAHWEDEASDDII